MRKSIYTILAVSALVFPITSCEKDKPLNEAIIGYWEVQTEQQIYYLENAKKFEYTYYFESGELAYEFTGAGSIINYSDGDVYGMTTFAISGNEIIIEGGDTDFIWKEVSADSKTLTWMETSTEISGEITYDVEIIYTAVKAD